MDVKYINPFLEASYNILPVFGLKSIKRGSMQLKKKMYVNMDVTSILGLTGSIAGKISYSFSRSTASRVASVMSGTDIKDMGEEVRDAIAELSNMITGKGCNILSNNDLFTDFTVPSILTGNNIFFLISPIETIAIDIETEIGKMQMNIGFEG